MSSMQDFFIINPNINKECKKYIWFNNNEILTVRRLLEFFIRRDIYIDGFITDSSTEIGIYVWNKEILCIDTIDRENSLIFYDKEVQGLDEIQNIVCINPQINLKNIVVYGAGNDGMHLAAARYKLMFDIQMFIDSDINKAGSKLDEIPICGIEALERLPEDVYVVIAANEACLEIDEVIAECLPDNMRFHYNYREIYKAINEKILIDKNEIFYTNYVGTMRNVLRGKKVVMYGRTDRSRKIARIYELLGFHVDGYIDNGIYEDTKQDDTKIIPLEEIIYEDNLFMLINRSDYRNVASKIEDLGLSIMKDFALDNPFQVSYMGIRDGILDINLGHSFIGAQGLCGFTVIGDYSPSNMKIIILGASTSEGDLYPLKSWPEFLYDRINNTNVTIYNGSVAAYTSTQELIKLLRDVLFLKPDIVIVYDGVLDMFSVSDDNPFAFGEMKKIIKYADHNKDKIWLDFFTEGVTPYLGVKPDADKFDIWLNNIKKMRLICESEGIRFFSFLQPCLISKQGKTKEEYGLLWSSKNEDKDFDCAEEFRNRMEHIVKNEEGVYDLTTIFDEKTDIYIDECHVFEKGNEIIANQIFETMKMEGVIFA